MVHNHTTNSTNGNNGPLVIIQTNEGGDRFESDCYKQVMRICTDVETFLGIFSQNRRSTIDRRKTQDKEKPIDANCCFYQGDLDRRKQVNRRNMERRNDSGKGDNKGVGYQNKRQYDTSELNRSESIKEIKKMLDDIDRGGEEILKIRMYLLLVQLHSEDNDKKIREKYFYKALKIAIKHWGRKYTGTDHEWNIIAVYLSNIDSTDQKLFKDSESNVYLGMLYKQIIKEYDEIIAEYKIKELEKKKKKDNVIDTLGGVGTKPVNAITKELDSIFPDGIQFSIISDATGMVILDHQGKKSENFNLNDSFKKIPISLDILDKEESYSCYWHLEGCLNPENHYSDDELETRIKPKIESAIRHQILKLVIETQKNHNHLESTKEKMTDFDMYDTIDYSYPIMGILGRDSGNLYLHKLQENPEYLSELSKAINITNKIVFCNDAIPIDSQELSQRIDSILGGNIKRSILDMVTTMLLHIHETSSGFGYPFGHNTKIIPFEGKIYQIIRAYIILSHKGKEECIYTMKTLGKTGYFDPNILQTFLDYLNISTTFPEFYPPQDTTSVVTPYRAEIYTNYLQKWSKMMEIIQCMGTFFHEYQIMNLEDKKNVDEVKQKHISMDLGNLQKEILGIIAQQKTVLIITHVTALSDEKKIFGYEDEPISEAGQENAKKIGEKLRNVDINRILTSESLRTKQTAKCICQIINNCSTNCKYCSLIHIEKGLKNPLKIDPKRFVFPEMRMITDDYRGLGKLIMNLVSGPEKGVSLIVTHREPAMVFLNTLKHTLSNNEPNIVAKNSIVELHFKGKTLLHNWNEEIFFPALNSNPILSEVNTITESVFGNIFHSSENLRINPTKLGEKFLDFCNSMYEKSPEIFERFVEKLEKGNHTKHFPNILKAKRVMK